MMSQSECLKNKSSADPELFVLTNTCYSSYSLSPKYTSFFSFTAVNWTVFFFTCLKKQEEMLVSVSESLQSEAGSAAEMKQTTKTYHTIHLVMGTRSLKLKLRMRYIIQQ